MYCVKCGCKINIGEKKCSDCGADVSGIEYCGGFWGLVGEDKKRSDVPCPEGHIMNMNKKEKIVQVNEIEPEPIKRIINRAANEEFKETSKNESYIKRKYRKKNQLLTGLLIVIMLVCLVVDFSLLKKYKNAQTEYQNKSEDYQELYDKYKKLEKDLKKINKKSNGEFDKDSSEDDKGEDNSSNEQTGEFDSRNDEVGSNFSDKQIVIDNKTTDYSRQMKGEIENE